MKIFILIALRNLYSHKTRSLILGGAIASVALVLTMMLALIQGVKSTMVKNGTALMSGHINIAGFYKITESSASPTVTNYPELLKIAQNEIPEAELIIDRVKAYGKIISEMESIQVPMWGIDIDQEKNILAKLELANLEEYWAPTELTKENKRGPSIEGSIFDLKNRGTIVLFATQAKKLKARVGDLLTVSLPTYRNISNTKDVRVVAVLRDLGLMSQFSAFLNAQDTREIYQLNSTTTGQLMIFLKDINLVPKVEDRLRKVFSQLNYKVMEKDSQPFFMKMDNVAGESWTGQKIDITTWEDETSFLKWVVQLLTALTYALVIILLIIIVIGLMNTLWMAIRERTAEIGTLRAIGLQRSQVFRLFLLESFFLCLGGTLSGSLLGTLLSLLLDTLKIPLTIETLKVFLMSNTLSFQIGGMEILQVFSIMLSFLILGSLVPIWQASRLKPVTAMQNAT